MTKTLCKITLVMAFVVVTLGALTRLLDAGLACPDWPGCYGQITPPKSGLLAEDNAKAWMEMIHRYLASALGLAILIIAVKIQVDKALSSTVKLLSLGLLALVIVQGLFGMLTVTMKLLPQVVTLHLLGGMATLALLFLLVLQLRSVKPVTIPAKLKSLALVVLILLSVQIAIGGWTSSNYAGLACPDFPTCQQQWLPDMNLAVAFNITQIHDHNYLGGGLLSAQSVVTIQVVHRIFALVLLLTVVTLCARLWSFSDARIPVAILLALTFVQIGIGIANALLLLPLPLALAHNTGAAILLLNVVYINYILLSKMNSNNH
ncbi:MAG: COX15/CtaA family protein [Pseudomonadota bacterium]|nr:COX15/CtaA family protein [Pseudomonadota bacterium]